MIFNPWLTCPSLLSIRIYGEWFQGHHAWRAWKQIIPLNKLLGCICLHAFMDQLKSWEQSNGLSVRWEDGSNGHLRVFSFASIWDTKAFPSGLPILLPHVGAPASRCPLRRTIQEIITPGKGIFQPNKNLHRKHLLSQWKTEDFKNGKTESQTVLGPNSELL